MNGAEYREIRKKKLDITQQELAAAVGVAVSTIQAREQQPEKEVGSEAEIAILSLHGQSANIKIGALQERSQGAE